MLIAVGEDRQIGFAEFGAPQGRAVFWLHGTPGARRQIPTEARVYAEHHDVRLIGVDRPGIGSSTPYEYETIASFGDDLRTIADTLGIDKMAVVGLSGGGPYTLACAAALPDRVVAAGVLGGVAPTCGPDAISGGLMNLGSAVAPLLKRTCHRPPRGKPMLRAGIGTFEKFATTTTSSPSPPFSQRWKARVLFRTSKWKTLRFWPVRPPVSPARLRLRAIKSWYI